MASPMVRIIGGEFRGRMVPCEVHTDLRPTPDRVREALFNILAPEIPGNLFIDVFAGTGVVGLEALGRGAREVWFVEWDGKNAASIHKLADQFRVGQKIRVIRADVYRWLENWTPPTEPVVMFFSPPFPDLEQRPELLIAGVESAIQTLHPESTLVVQVETGCVLNWTKDWGWEERKYGRNLLLILRPRVGESEQANPDQDEGETHG